MIPTVKPNPLFDNLTLLGTVHRDPRGMARLSEFYRFFGPDCILLEFSRHGLEFRLENQARLHKDLIDNLRQISRQSCISLKALMKHPEVAAIRRQISLPFEFRASRQYSLAAGIPFCLIDRSDFSHRWISFWPELISVKNLRLLISSQLRAQGSCACQYGQAALRMHIGRPGHIRHYSTGRASSDFHWVKREQHLARKTVAVLCKMEPTRPLFVGGWQHLVPGECPPTLRDYLNVKAHQCILLDRAKTGPQGFSRNDPVHKATPWKRSSPGK